MSNTNRQKADKSKSFYYLTWPDPIIISIAVFLSRQITYFYYCLIVIRTPWGILISRCTFDSLIADYRFRIEYISASLHRTYVGDEPLKNLRWIFF